MRRSASATGYVTEHTQLEIDGDMVGFLMLCQCAYTYIYTYITLHYIRLYYIISYYIILYYYIILSYITCMCIYCYTHTYNIYIYIYINSCIYIYI